jgi:hypothetical protein
MAINISEPQYEIICSDADINLFLAGVGSGKTFLGGIISYIFIKKYPQLFGFIAANTFDQLDKSTLFRIKETWKEMGITEWSKENPQGVYVSGKKPPPHFITDSHNFDSYHSIISFNTGKAIFTGSLENAKSHDGKQFAWAILDETKDTRENDVKEIILARLRQQGIKINGKEVCPLYILTSPAKVEWINKWFDLETYMDEISSKIYNFPDYFTNKSKDKFVVISSTHHNQDNLPKNYIQKILDNNTDERGKALIFANPFATTGGEFYSSFSRAEHVKPCIYDPAKPLHPSFDQNVVPYCPALLTQIEKVGELWHVYFFAEIALKNPRNTTEDVCEEILRQYGDSDGLFYYGDASGKNRKGMTKDIKHHYQIVEKVLRKKLTGASNRVLRSNPSLTKRRDFINKCLENKLPIRIFIDPKCIHLLADLTYLKQDIDGTKKKELHRDSETKETYQKYGHLSDCMDYFLCAAFDMYFKEF